MTNKISDRQLFPGSAGKAAPPGRPAPDAQRDVYMQLLRAAEDRLVKGTYASIRVREIAASAGVNPAMVNYYFGSKMGLFAALIRFVYSDWLKALERIRRNLADTSKDPIDDLAETIVSSFGPFPGVLRLVRREHLESASTLRRNFDENFASRSATALRRLIDDGVAVGRFSSALDARYVAYVIGVVAVQPFALGEDLARSFSIDPTELTGPAWRRFLVVLMTGLLNPATLPEVPIAPEMNLD